MKQEGDIEDRRRSLSKSQSVCRKQRKKVQKTSICNVSYQRSPSTLTLKSCNQYEFFCDWYPLLFGIDENIMASSADEEEILEEIKDSDLDELANSLTPSQLSELRDKFGKNLTDSQVRFEWKKDQVPRYGRRSRPKPLLTRDDGVKFECSCDIDFSFSRYHIPRFQGGVKEEGEEWKTPHFVAFWEDYHERKMSHEDPWNAILEKKQEEEIDIQKGLFFRPVPKFPGSGQKDIKAFKEQLLNSFRPLTCREVRRYRLPYAEALYLELQEDLYLESAAFFKDLIVQDYYVNIQQETSPALRETKTKMDKLVAFLKLAEKFSRRKEYHEEAIILLKSGKYFNDHNQNWWWLAEALYTKAVEVSQKAVIDGGRSQALSRYILGIFLLEYVNRVQPAQEHLSKARELSLGKDWSAAKILGKPQDLVHRECVNYLCRALIEASTELRKNGRPEEALPLIHRSHKLCSESGFTHHDVKMNTYFELGRTYQALGMLDWAKTAFRKFIEIAKLENYTRSICDGYLQLAICFRSEGDMAKCHHNLSNYLETAENRGDENLVAFGHRYLGEFHLNNGNNKIAAELFRIAFKLFHQQSQDSVKIPFEEWKPEHFTLTHDTELSRVLIGLAEGEMYTKSICHLILQARDSKNPKDLLRLIDWKNAKDKTAPAEETRYASISTGVPDAETGDFQLGVDIESPEDSDEIDLEDMRIVQFKNVM